MHITQKLRKITQNYAKLRKNYAKKLRKNYAYVCNLHNLHYYAPPALLMMVSGGHGLRGAR